MDNQCPANTSVEHITWNDQHIAAIIRRDFMPTEITFFSPDSYDQQLGFIVYQKDGVVARQTPSCRYNDTLTVPPKPC